MEDFADCIDNTISVRILANRKIKYGETNKPIRENQDKVSAVTKAGNVPHGQQDPTSHKTQQF